MTTNIREMATFHGNPKVKAEFLHRVRDHRLADEIIQGAYNYQGKWDAIGATVHSGNHIDYEKLLGIPFVIARIQDRVHEALPDPDFKFWPEAFLEAIPVGVTLKMAPYKFFAKVMYGTKYSLFTSEVNHSTETDLKVVSDYLLIRMKRQTTEEERAKLILAETNLKALSGINHAANAAYMLVSYFKNKEQPWMVDKGMASAKSAYLQRFSEEEKKEQGFNFGKGFRDELLTIISDPQFKS